MSGDVQPRKRKDKKRKKDDLGHDVPHESPGTAAVLGEGDVFMHSYHDHGTGGHWCAKIIFFSLLAILITLIGLIILENRGLSELEANSVESRYSGVLEGWLEDAPDDDHHDVHTLELTHHEDEDDHDDNHELDEGYGDSEDDDHDLDDDHDHDLDDDHDHDLDDEHDHDIGHDDLEDDDDDDQREDNDHVERDDDIDNEDGQEMKMSEDTEEEGYFSKIFSAISTATTNDMDGNQNQNNNYQDLNDDEQDLNDDAQDLNDENQDLSDDDESWNKEDEDENNAYDNDLYDTSKEFDDVEERSVEKKYGNDNFNDDQDDDEDNDDNEENYNSYRTVESNDKEYENEPRSNEQNFFNDYAYSRNDKEDDDDHDDDEHDEENDEVELERIEREALESQDPISTELPVLPEPDDDKSAQDNDDDLDSDDDGDEDEDFLDADPPPVVERITAPAGKPFQEIEEESSERPPSTLEEEEEYEKKQEELRRQAEEASSRMWLKLAVGGALLVATFGLISRALGPGDSPEEDTGARGETPVRDRRMTLIDTIPEEPESPQIVATKKDPLEAKTEVLKELYEKSIPLLEKSLDLAGQEIDDEELLDEPEDVEPNEEQELYSEEDFEDEEEEIIDDEGERDKDQNKVPKKLPMSPILLRVPKDEEVIYNDEQLEEEEEEEEEYEEEDDISDVDDTELLKRLEAKYGRLPDPERPGPTHSKGQDGGNSMEDWHGEPSDPFWRKQLESAERELRQGKYMSAVDRASATELSSSARARWIAATALDRAAEAERDNRILSRAIAAYLELLKLNERLSDKKLVEIASRTLDRIQFRGTYLSAEPVYRLLIRRFPDNVSYRNNLTVAYLMANRADLAETLLQDILLQWPNDRHALAHYGFVLKTLRNKHKEAVELFRKALEGDTGPACEPRFYYHYGDALLLLGRYEEAHEVHKRAAKRGHFLSPAQRSLYNVPRLKGQPWWNVEDTPYVNLARALERNWREILKEGQAAKALYEQEKEGLRERGEWSQLDLFVRGREIPDRCQRAPVTCAVVKTELAAATCRRGQIKFSSMEAGTHVRPHVGPTNCRLRMHLGLSNTKDTYIRVDQEIRQWQEGKVLLFDDSFEHEVWHNGTGTRLVLIVDVWHPELTAAERRQLPAI